MSNFEDDILRPEEIAGGFEPIDGDDTFAIDSMMEYPGNLPDFNPVSEPEVEDVAEPEVAEENIVDSDDAISAELDVAQESESEPEDEDELELEDEPESELEYEVELESEPEPDSELEDEVEIEDEDELESELEDELESEPEYEFEPESEDDFAKWNEEPTKLDEDVQKEYVTPEIEKAVVTEENQSDFSLAGINLDDLFADAPKEEAVTAVPVDDSPEAKLEFAGLQEEIEEKPGGIIETDFPDHISSIGVENIDEESEPEVEEKLKQGAEKNKKTKTEKKKSGRKMWIPVAACLLLLIGGVIYFLSSGLDSFFTGDKKSDTTIAKVATPEKKTKAKTVLSEAKSSDEKVADSLQAAPIEEPKPKEIELPVQQNIDKSVNTNIGNDLTIETKPAKVAPQKKYSERSAKTKVLARKRRAINANVAASSQANNAQASQITDPQIYVIQFYASPSQSDAEQWLRKVQNKVGNKAYISTQIVRDQVWYRVRCGTFSTKEEATVAARKYGFSQSWVDRIR